MTHPLRTRASLAGALLALAPALGAQGTNDVYSGTLLDYADEVLKLFANPDGTIVLTGYNLITPGIVVNCPGQTALNQQIGLTRGFDGVNGLVISNGYVEDIEDDNVGFGSPTGCIAGSGSIGLPFCTAVDPSLAFLGPTEDACVLILNFLVTVPTEIDFAYEFVTHEDVLDPAFFDVFGIFLNGTMLAGGSSNNGPAPGTDPWVLAPSSQNPHEFNSLPGTSLAVTPAFRTGRRVLTVPLDVGSYSLQYHIADSGPFQFCGTGSSDSTVLSSLFFGLHTWRGDDAAGVTPGLDIDYLGHPGLDDSNGGTFPADFQVTLAGAPPGSTAFLLRGPLVQSPPALIPLYAPLEILVGPTLFFESTEAVDPLGRAIYPNPPGPIPPTVVGTPTHFQWFGLDLAGQYFATKGLRVKF